MCVTWCTLPTPLHEFATNTVATRKKPPMGSMPETTTSSRCGLSRVARAVDTAGLSCSQCKNLRNAHCPHHQEYGSFKPDSSFTSNSCTVEYEKWSDARPLSGARPSSTEIEPLEMPRFQRNSRETRVGNGCLQHTHTHTIMLQETLANSAVVREMPCTVGKRGLRPLHLWLSCSELREVSDT